jgi:serine/threonine protein kinase
MAKYIPIGEPVNQSEADAIRLLRDSLPEHFIVLGNFELQLPNRANTFEYDAVVIGEYGLYAVEIKGWSGEIRGDARRWYLDWGRVQNPLILTERKAKALRGFVWRSIRELPRNIFCKAVVMLPSGANVMVEDSRAEHIITPDELFDFFVDEDRIREHGPGALLDAALRDQVKQVLLPLASPASQTPRISDYEILGELDIPNVPYREFVGRHRLLQSRSRVRLKRYSLDPLATSSERDREIGRVLRDMEALTALKSNQYIASAFDVIRDQEDELNFYLVSEWVGPKTLSDWIAEQEYTPGPPDQETRRIATHLLRAVDFMHEQGIVHRNLHPGVIYMTRDEDERVPLKLTDFDYARVSQLPSIEGSFDQVGTEGYAAPELLTSDDYDHRVDLFSTGAILYELLTGNRLYETISEMLNPAETWAMRRKALDDEQCLYALDQLLQPDPAKRPADLSDLIARCKGDD